MAKRIRNKIKVAVDPSAVIDLFTLIHPKHDIDGKVMRALEQGTLRAKDWEGLNENEIPKLLKDRNLGRVKNGRYYKLENVYDFLQLILSGKVEIYITPSTFYQLTGFNDMEMDFLEEHIHNLTISNKDANEILGHVYDLAREYIKAEQQARDGENKAFKYAQFKAHVIAEAAMCGLPLITNDTTLVHITPNGYEMTEIIKNVNRNFDKYNLGVESKRNKIITPTTISLTSFLKALEDGRTYLYPNNQKLRINTEDDTIALR